MEDYSDLVEFAFSIAMGLAMFQCVMIYLVIIIYNRKRITEIFEYFEGLVASSDPIMSKIRQKHFTTNTRIAYICASGFTSPMFFLIPGIPRDSIFFYPVNLINQTFLFFSAYELIMVSDIIIMITIVCCKAELDAIAELIATLNHEDLAANEGRVIVRKVYEIHMDLAVQADKLTIAFWHIYLQKLLVIMLYLCSMFLIFQEKDGFSYEAICSIFVILSQTFILCYFGQIIMNSSEVMSDSFYMTKWYELDIRAQKNLLILMMRFQHPVKVETFGFGTISLYTFVQICKISFSYAAILYALFN
ncbi:odorant receptor 85b-like [Lutzomyia longipalpis]|uniref:odorant receptor 85b-like n=1 Tax=Lutzomyia longipalpis TaxID=7200 RepID=UPI002483F971|nr:odorant receptor 85b-like [Lutzomyia longipalpis]